MLISPLSLYTGMHSEVSPMYCSFFYGLGHNGSCFDSPRNQFGLQAHPFSLLLVQIEGTEFTQVGLWSHRGRRRMQMCVRLRGSSCTVFTAATLNCALKMSFITAI